MGMAGRRRRGRGKSGEEGRWGGMIHEMDGAGLQDPAEGMADGAAWSRSGAGAWGAAQLDGVGDRGGGRMWLGAKAVVLAMAPVHRDGRGSERRRGGGGRGGSSEEGGEGIGRRVARCDGCVAAVWEDDGERGSSDALPCG